MLIYTCTPVAFGGGSDFFARDSGLLCRGFQAIGVESRAVMPGERKPEDQADLIRTEYRNLESAEWWKAQGIDGVVLYAWGRPKFHRVAAAIRDAGIFLVLNLDSGGLISPWVGWRDWLRAQWIFSGQGRGAKSYLRFATLTLRRLGVGFLLTERLRAKHLRCGDVIACVSPGAAEYVRRLCHHHGGEKLAAKIRVIPHSVEPSFRYSGAQKLRQVACVGRWMDRLQKRPGLLMEVIGLLLGKDEAVKIVIVGQPAPELSEWHRGLGENLRARINLAGIIGREELAALLDESMVFYSPSAYESFGIAAAEALCSGCSVVAGRSVTMTSFEWFVSENSGQLAISDDPEVHVESLLRELSAWDEDGRDPGAISGVWRARLHADRVAHMILESTCG